METDMTMTPAREDTGNVGTLGAIGVGAALMYFLDPDSGARRRRTMRDKLVRSRHAAGNVLRTTARDVGNRARGLAAETRARLSADDADDRVIEQRVRAELGRAISHPGAIEVSAEAGHVTLRGAVLAHETERLLRRVRKVRGVESVENRLAMYAHGDDVPGLQGEGPRAARDPEVRHDSWTPAARLLTSIAGGTLALYGSRQRDGVGAAMGLAGLALLMRSVTNTPYRRLVGVGGDRDAVGVQKTITIDAPISRVYTYLTEWERWPQWMTHVRAVTSRGTDDGAERTHWSVDGPLGVPVTWDAVTTRLVPEQEIAWESVEGSAVKHTGVIRLTRQDEGATRVDVRMAYTPPAGVLGHAVAAWFGRDPKRQMDDDLVRLRTTIETGRPPHDAAHPEPRLEGTAAGGSTAALGDTAPATAADRR